MRIALITILLVLFGSANLIAQSQATVDKAAIDNQSCMLMSDSMKTALGLTEEQTALVRCSDEVCMKACEKAGYRVSGTMDEQAMQVHAAEMAEILNAEQFTKWSAMCPQYKASQTEPEQGKY